MSTNTESKPWKLELDEFMDLHPVGSEITYLGVRMMVTSAVKATFYQNPYGGTTQFVNEPKFTCDYVDTTGVIHTKEFTITEALRCVAKQNPRPVTGEG